MVALRLVSKTFDGGFRQSHGWMLVARALHIEHRAKTKRMRELEIELSASATNSVFQIDIAGTTSSPLNLFGPNPNTRTLTLCRLTLTRTRTLTRA